MRVQPQQQPGAQQVPGSGFGPQQQHVCPTQNRSWNATQAANIVMQKRKSKITIRQAKTQKSAMAGIGFKIPKKNAHAVVIVVAIIAEKERR
jgi:hypothetical protein